MTEDFPTPPFPEAIPMTRVSESGCANGINFSRPPRTIFLTLFRWSSVMTPKVKSTDVTPFTAVIADVTSVRKRSCIGHAEIVSNSVRVTAPLFSCKSSTIPKSVIGWRSSGS